MDWSWEYLVLAALAGLIGGSVNSLAGGGTLITFPALTALGIPALQANVTNTMALIPGYLSGSIAQREAILGQPRQVLIAIPAAVLGGFLGGWLLLGTDPSIFEKLVPWLILLATLLLALEERIKSAVGRLSGHGSKDERAGRGNDFALAGVVFIGALYGGFFGAGLGIVVLALMGLVMSETLTRINAVKQTVSLTANGAAAFLFYGSGYIEWPAAIALGIGAFAGGELGGLFAAKVNPRLLRIVVVILGLAISVAFFIKHY
jgi:uncharacterized membrane protein YfcA